jgi:hypothetical protein
MREDMKRLTLAMDGGPDTDAEEIADLAAQLRRHLLELDVEAVELIRIDEVPSGAKPGEVVALGALAITLAPIALRGVVGVIETWLKNRPVRAVKITLDGDTLELSHPSKAAQKQLVQAFIDSHAN